MIVYRLSLSLLVVVATLPYAVQAQETGLPPSGDASAHSPFPPGTYLFSAPSAPPKAALVFERDGAFTMTIGGQPFGPPGEYVATERHLVLTDPLSAGAEVCGSARTSIYAWELQGSELRLSVVDDRCERRVEALTESALVKQ